MNREILFRGKRELDGKWIYGLYSDDYVYETDFPCIMPLRSGNDYEDWSVIRETVGQYTGLTDNNDKKIFEGDIFKFKDEVWESCYTSCGTEYDSWEVENYGVVGFDEDTGRFDFIKYKYNENSVEADLHENHDIEFSDFVGTLEVIGNIYDNPELMEVQHE